ncbi:hypothetical protein F2P81_018723 [Scophthalmus maximus]|uniref:Uncharacterized protein n=1 Tax=Scophthalmus maximus TaxID=52904 RepID=A0A6A4SBE3_SCOMX|nr:hypothetical protein F2P81_018723 [Scophthalmus maximus]
MAFIEGSRGIYGPIKVMIDRPIYERALEICWHILSYKNYIAVLTELLRLQQEDRIPSELTVEDMTDQFLEESKKSLRMRRWDFEREGFSDDFQPFLKMVMDVLTSMKMRDVQFEARWLFEYPEDIPPCFQNPKIMKLAQKFGESLTEQLQATPRSRLLGPSEVVVEVVPKVLQGFWLPSPTTYLNMPSQELSDMAVGVTKAVMDRVTRALSSGLHRVNVSRPIRDAVVLSVQERVRQMYPEDILRQRLDCFAAQLLDEIAEAATRDICALFQPQADTDTPSIPDRDDTVQRPTKELDSPVAAAPSHHVTSADEPVSQVEAEQPATNSSTSSAENSTPAITWIVEGKEPKKNIFYPDIKFLLFS